MANHIVDTGISKSARFGEREHLPIEITTPHVLSTLAQQNLKATIGMPQPNLVPQADYPVPHPSTSASTQESFSIMPIECHHHTLVVVDTKSVTSAALISRS